MIALIDLTDVETTPCRWGRRTRSRSPGRGSRPSSGFDARDHADEAREPSHSSCQSQDSTVVDSRRHRGHRWLVCLPERMPGLVHPRTAPSGRLGIRGPRTASGRSPRRVAVQRWRWARIRVGSSRSICRPTWRSPASGSTVPPAHPRPRHVVLPAERRPRRPADLPADGGQPTAEDGHADPGSLVPGRGRGRSPCHPRTGPGERPWSSTDESPWNTTTLAVRWTTHSGY